jgi:hypothetical protein
MKVKEFDIMFDEILESETKKLIIEQLESQNNSVDKIKSFQTLSCLLDKVTNVEDITGGIMINLHASEQDFLQCVGGTSFEEAQNNLLQGLHTDLSENGHGDNFDVEFHSEGDETGLSVNIKITENKEELLGATEMNESKNIPIVDPKNGCTKCGKKSKEIKEKAELILDKDKKVCDECGKEMVKGEQHECSTPKKKKIVKLTEASMIKLIEKIIKEQEDMSDYDAPESEVEEGEVKTVEVGEGEVKTVEVGEGEIKTVEVGEGEEEDSEEGDIDENESQYRKVPKVPVKLNESKGKKVIRLSEEKIIRLIENMVLEGLPGLAVSKKVHGESGKVNKDNLSNVTKKIKSYLKFKGNDNPEFPNQVGKKTEKKARQNTNEEDEVVEAERGRGMQNLVYSGKKDPKVTEKIKKNLTGDKKMGNSQDAGNAIKTNTGDKMFKSIDKKEKAKKEEPLYNKEVVPVNTSKKEVNESKMDTIITEEIKRMKDMFNYQVKGQ